MVDEKLRDEVRERYGELARRSGSAQQSCCGSDCDPITRDLYGSEETGGVPEEALAASLGCGNPVARAELAPGEVVLDLGSGGGIDVLLSARRVGPLGKAYGLDMTPDMLALARENARKAGADNVEFLEGTLEDIPLPEASVDVVISNCVVNLSTDKPRTLAETFRVLRPGGRVAIADVVLQRELPPAVQRSVELWAGCVAGALQVEKYREILERAGFAEIELEIQREYGGEELAGLAASAGAGEFPPGELAGAAASVLVRARKPAAKAATSCCAPTCC